MEEALNKTKSKRVIIFLAITVLFFIVYGWGNLKCGLGAGGADQLFCYIPMAAALVDDDPDTIYSCRYGGGTGAVLPLTYALAWKVTYSTIRTLDFRHNNFPSTLNDFRNFMKTEKRGDKNYYQNYEKTEKRDGGYFLFFAMERLPKIIGVLGAFYMISALYVLLSLTLRTEHVIIFLISMGFYLQIDPFFESLNNGMIDCLYFFITSIGVYYLVQGLIQGKSKDLCMLAVICFVLPMVRANGMFLILWTGAAFGIMLVTSFNDKHKSARLLKQCLIIVVAFVICNIIYEIFILLAGWQPDIEMMKHHPLIIMFFPWLDFNLFSAGGHDEYTQLFNDFKNISSFHDALLALKMYVLSMANHVRYLFNQSTGGVLENNFWHCKNTVLHLVHGSFIKYPVAVFTIMSTNIIFLLYQVQKKDKVIPLMYLGGICILITQSLIMYDARYYMFVYFMLFYPFLWLLDKLAGKIKYQLKFRPITLS